MVFLPGLELSRRFCTEVVAPLLARRWPRLRYAAGRLDSGSELLGFDTARSADHDWGPRLQLFLDPADAGLVPRILAACDTDLPATFLGLPTRFTGPGLGVPTPAGERHGVGVEILDAWLVARLGSDPRAGMSTADWLSLPTQRLAEVTGGAVFADGLAGPGGSGAPGAPADSGGPGAPGGLGAVRARLAWYPDDVWRHVLAAQWTRVAQEEAFVGRCGEVGDELGSAVVAARLARDLMRLCLLLARRYPPYGKWLGSAFAALPEIGPVAGALSGALAAGGWREREEHLCRAYERVAARTNALGLAAPQDPTVRRFYDRPFRVLDAGRFADALRASIGDPHLRALPPVGAVDQYADSTDVLTHTGRARAVAGGWLAYGR
jgi:hypothetical protein